MVEVEILPNVFVEAEFLEDGANLVERYLDIDKLSGGSWHNKEEKVLHISPLLTCMKKSYNNVVLGETNSLETKGAWLVGTIDHNIFQDNVCETDGFYIKEFPLTVDLDFENGEFKLEVEVEDTVIYLVGKIDLIHNREHRVEDLKTFQHIYLPKYPEKVDLKYYIQPIVYTFVANHTYYAFEPITTVYVVCISKKNLYTKILSIEYNEKVGLACYQWLVKRAKEMYGSIESLTCPKGEPSKWCQWCFWLNLPCAEGREHLKDILEPITLESTQFKKKFPDKNPYYRRNDKWNETKLFKEFKTTLKNQ